MTIFREGCEPFHVMTPVRQVFDVTGAGDTVIAMCALALACGLSLQDGVCLASRAAALAVEKLGTATVTLAELDRVCSE